MADKEPKKEQGLSTYVDYAIKEVPKNVSLKEGTYYKISDGYGVHEVLIEGIRQLGEEVIIYYRKKKDGSGFTPTYEYHQVPLNTFKMKMMDFGKLKEIEIFHPGKSNE